MVPTTPFEIEFYRMNDSNQLFRFGAIPVLKAIAHNWLYKNIAYDMFSNGCYFPPVRLDLLLCQKYVF